VDDTLQARDALRLEEADFSVSNRRPLIGNL